MQIHIPSSEKDKDRAFREAKHSLLHPQKSSRVLVSTSVKNLPEGENVIRVPSFKDCLDEHGNYSQDLFDQEVAKLS